MNLIEIIYNYKKASVMRKFIGELLHRLESKVGSSSNVEVNTSNVSNIPPDTLFDLDTCTVETQVEWSVKRYHHFKICPQVTILVCNMAPGFRQQALERGNQF